jgi:transcriptional regulator with XRE-family HTH domain
MSDSDFRALLSRLRQRGMTLREIGMGLGVTPQIVAVWLAGSSRPTLTVRLLARHAFRDEPTWPPLE